MQRVDLYRTAEETDGWRRRWGKPVVVDEMGYEGDLEYGWGNITGEELVRRHWECALRGGWGGHGETYLDSDDVLWWAKGGVLKGTSVPRIAFLADVLADAPGDLEPSLSGDFPAATVGETYALYYGSFMQPGRMKLNLPGGEWRLELLDTWNMTVTPIDGVWSGVPTIPLPGRPFIAVRARRMADTD
jgi:Domain of unknown function (DUF5605)